MARRQQGQLLALTGGAGRPQVGRLLKVDRQCFRCGRSSQAGPEAEFLRSMNAAYSGLELSVTRAIQAEPHDQATRCRGNVEGLHTLVQAAGALAASGHPVRVNDGEHPRQRVQN